LICLFTHASTGCCGTPLASGQVRDLLLGMGYTAADVPNTQGVMRKPFTQKSAYPLLLAAAVAAALLASASCAAPGSGTVTPSVVGGKTAPQNRCAPIPHVLVAFSRVQAAGHRSHGVSSLLEMADSGEKRQHEQRTAALPPTSLAAAARSCYASFD
jgi:hypothetical protein